MDIVGEIADATIRGLKKEKQFANWSDERFSELRALLTTDFPDTAEAMGEYVQAISDLLTREDDVSDGKKTRLTEQQSTVLEAIREHPRTRQDLIDDLGIHPQSMHYILKVLKTRKLVRTITDPTLSDLRKRIYMVIEE